MLNRLAMGALRYGLLNQEDKPNFDSMASAYVRIKELSRTGNIENFVDIANLCLIESIESRRKIKKKSNILDPQAPIPSLIKYYLRYPNHPLLIHIAQTCCELFTDLIDLPHYHFTPTDEHTNHVKPK